MSFLGLPQLRYHSPWVQNLISGIGVGASAGIYVALNLLGAGGGRPDSAQVVQVVNATLCAVWFFSSSFGGSILNKLGPGLTMCIGVQTYAVYVGSLWYYDETGKKGYPYAAGPIIGIGAGMVFITAGYVATGYPEEREKGSYATILMNMQALGSVISGIIPVIINRNSDTVAGVPRSVYISFIVIMIIGGLITLLLLRPQKLTRDDGSVVAVHPPRGAWEELRSNLLIFTDPILLMMIPAFLPSEGFLVYSGSVNGTCPVHIVFATADKNSLQQQSANPVPPSLRCGGDANPCRMGVAGNSRLSWLGSSQAWLGRANKCRSTTSHRMGMGNGKHPMNLAGRTQAHDARSAPAITIAMIRPP